VRLAGICAEIGVEILPTTATVRAGQTTRDQRYRTYSTITARGTSSNF